jgi:hypothetical protein
MTVHRDRFALKGAMLMTTWFDNPFRPTRDVDLLGFGDPDPEVVLAVFREICSVPSNDAVTFDNNALAVDFIRDETDYGGLRIKTDANVDGARVRVVIDIGFGDAIEPGLADAELPVLLDQPAPRLRAYARETVIAEKFQAMVVLGRANSRMKDLYDIWMLSKTHEFTGDRLPRAIAATFARRKTAIPVDPPDTLTPAFAEDQAKQRQWDAFLANIGAQHVSLAEVLEDLAKFLMPRANEARLLNVDK